MIKKLKNSFRFLVSFGMTHRGMIKKWGKWSVLAGLLVFSVWYINCLPDKLFNDSTSTVLLDKNGNLLGAKIAGDGQWRFSPKKLFH